LPRSVANAVSTSLLPRVEFTISPSAACGGIL
jgi:hypothetical protein